MIPGDIDIYTRDRQAVEEFAELMKPFSLKKKSESPHGDNWLSSYEEPTFTQTFSSGFSWTKGRWVIEGFKVEAVHISNSMGIPDSMTGDGIWEGGQYIWSLCKDVEVGPYIIRTIPLEIQLESNLRRKREDRSQAILEALFKFGYDHKLIEKALSKENLTYFYSVVN